MKYLFAFCFVSQIAFAQFAPPQGQPGSTAIYKDSSAFVAWVTSSKVVRGLQSIATPSLGYATVGDSTSPIGIADGTVVSLGDSGYAICSFQNEIYDGPGNDFAVFENSFDGLFLELGFVEVSSDGINFFRFPATSNTQDTAQTGAYGDTDATKVNNLGGKYKVLYGTPFDLIQMQGISGLDVNHIKQVKVIDVVGSITTQYATYDKNLNKVNDPWPTPFASCGFDLDAIGVINQQTTGIQQISNNEIFSVYPNPASNSLQVSFSGNITSIKIIDIMGVCVYHQIASSPNCQIDVTDLNNGVYLLQLNGNSGNAIKKIIISK
jgi:type IX secretion system substrate protein